MVSQQDKDAPKPDKHFVDATEGHSGSIMVVSAPHGRYALFLSIPLIFFFQKHALLFGAAS